MRGHRNGNHSPTSLPLAGKGGPDWLRRCAAPSRRAIAVALVWVVWFVCHVAIHGNDHLAIEGSSSGRRVRRQKLIEGRIIHKLPTHGLHADGTNVEYRCHVGEVVHHPKAYKLWGGLNGTRQPLEYPLNRSGLFDFATHISRTKLRVLIVGNSLGEQLHAGVEEAMCLPVNMTEGMTESDRRLFGKRSHCRTVYAENTDGQWIKDPRIVYNAAGGMVGVIKDNTNMINTKTKWMRNNTAVASLLKVLDKITNRSHVEEKAGRKELVDVLVYQFQSGHVDLRDFDEYYLEQAVRAAGELFGATSVVFPTIAWMNNIDESRADDWRAVNGRIRDFARRYTPETASSVASVQILDLAALSEQYIEANAQILGVRPDEMYALRLDNLWTSLVAQLCASLPFDEDPRGCLPGMVSLDGMHLCPETFHGRINAALVCLLDCRYNRRPPVDGLPTCSDGCNSRYMSLDPIRFAINADLEDEVVLTP